MSSVPDVTVVMDDPSEFRPEHKDKSEFRDFRLHTVPERVIKVYKEMHKKQTYAFAKGKLDAWSKLDHAEMTVMEALEKLNGFVDECDPDVHIPNSMHAFQTAEGIRKKFPDKEWFQVAGLIHDIGKMMAMWGEPQWCVVGDTFPVGCQHAKSIVFDAEFFSENADFHNDKMNTKLGIYEENCGLENVAMSWGHDEYLYRVLKGNTCHLPDEALYVIRFHSFYPWHMSGDYMHLCNNKDIEMLKWVKEFNQFDLYTKCPDIPDIDELLPYYTKLVEKFHSFYPWHMSGDYMHLCNNKDIEMLKWVKEFNQFDLYTKCPDIPDIDELLPYYTKLVEKYVPGKLKW